MRYGFIGTGGITTAIVTGLCTSDYPPQTIQVSPRNQENANRLAKQFEAVQVADLNQEVLDRSDIVVLAILPQHKEAVLAPLSFRNDHTVIHLLARTPIDVVLPLVSPAVEKRKTWFPPGRRVFLLGFQLVTLTIRRVVWVN